MNLVVKNIPNTITCINLLSGVIAIVLAFNGMEQCCGLPCWQWSCIFIGIAAVADFLDGFCARLLKAYSDLGKELDSLSDLVSFGVAPAMLTFNMLSAFNSPEWICWSALMLPVAGGVRLAKFNTDTRQTTSFLGLPIPANAIFWIGYVWICYSNSAVYFTPVFAFASMLILSGLMVSEMKMFSLKFKTFGLKDNLERWALIAVAILLISIFQVGGLMWLIVYYLIASSVSEIIKNRQK